MKNIRLLGKTVLSANIVLAIIVSLLFIVSSVVFGADKVDITKGKDLFNQARRSLYNNEASFDEVKKLLNSSQESFNSLPNSFEKYYWQAQVAFELAETNVYAGDKKQAEKYFTDSNNLVNKAIKVNPKSSDANRLLADTIMRLTDYKGPMYGMSQGLKALKLANYALRLDERNYAAMNSLGMYYINAPEIGGGDINKGIDILLKALENKDEFDLFTTYIWLATAYQKKKDNNECIKYCKKASEIYPNSSWVQTILSKTK